MLNISEAYEFEQKKIERNNMLIKIFSLSEAVLSFEIESKKELRKFYKGQRGILREINKIELLQSKEYTIQRQHQIDDMLKQIGAYTPSKYITEILERSNSCKKSIIEKNEEIKQIQEGIPQNGTVVNYKIKLSNLNETCATMAQKY